MVTKHAVNISLTLAAFDAASKVVASDNAHMRRFAERVTQTYIYVGVLQWNIWSFTAYFNALFIGQCHSTLGIFYTAPEAVCASQLHEFFGRMFRLKSFGCSDDDNLWPKSFIDIWTIWTISLLSALLARLQYLSSSNRTDERFGNKSSSGMHVCESFISLFTASNTYNIRFVSARNWVRWIRF